MSCDTVGCICHLVVASQISKSGSSSQSRLLRKYLPQFWESPTSVSIWELYVSGEEERI